MTDHAFTAQNDVTPRQRSWALPVILGLGALTLVRVIGLILSPVELHGDEAQYWTWAQELDWGYYSKPPLIAWTIALTTSLFGDAEWAIRLAAPLTHAGAAGFLGLFVRDLYREENGTALGLVTAAAYLTMPAVWLSSAVMSTDALLLLFWSAGLFAFGRLIRTRSLVWGVALGAAVGMAFLAKYAAIYFVVALGLWTLIDAAARRAVLSPAGGVAALVGAAIVSPNLIWNAANDFSTVSHTADNANWSGPLFRPEKLFEFWQEQLGVFGPITFLLLLAALLLWPLRNGDNRRRLLLLTVFTLPPLIVVSVQAFLSRAHGNWAASAYAAGTVLLVVYLFGPDGAWARSKGVTRTALASALALGVGINVFGGGVFAVSGASLALADRLCMPATNDCAGEAFKRARGWRETTSAIQSAYQSGAVDGRAYTAIVFDNRLVFHDVEYYARGEGLPLRMWRKLDVAKNHAEERAPLTAADAGPVLIVSIRPHDRDQMAADFGVFTPAGVTEIDLGAAGVRRLAFFTADDFAPLTRDEAYFERWR